MPTDPVRTHRRDFRVGRRLRENALAHLESEQSGLAPPSEQVPARPAATVLLVRDGPEAAPCPVQVFMLRRVPGMQFAPSVWVFPGGGVDPRDTDPQVPWSGPSPAAWARRLELPVLQAQALVVAAVREVFEECGVLLAGPDERAVVGEASTAGWEQERAALVDRSQSLGELLTRRGLRLRSDLLSYKDHWVTPAFEPRRYDTYFFAALLPRDQQADGLNTEADRTAWVYPGSALDRHATDRRTCALMPPTVVNLERVAAARSAQEFVAEQATVITVRPQPIRTDDGLVLRVVLPGPPEPSGGP